jgi:hypothetical protein
VDESTDAVLDGSVGDESDTDEASSGEDTNVTIDCDGSWGGWGGCSATCGGGEQSRSYTIVAAASGTGTACPADSPQSQGCNTDVCITVTGELLFADAAATAAVFGGAAVAGATLDMGSLSGDAATFVANTKAAIAGEIAGVDATDVAIDSVTMGSIVVAYTIEINDPALSGAAVEAGLKSMGVLSVAYGSAGATADASVTASVATLAAKTAAPSSVAAAAVSTAVVAATLASVISVGF